MFERALSVVVWEDVCTMAPGLGAEKRDRQRRWESRIDRARELQIVYPAVAQALRLYEETLKFQSRLAAASSIVAQPEIPLRAQIDISAAMSALATILPIAIQHGPDPLAAEARRLQHRKEQAWREVLNSALSRNGSSLTPSEEFFARVSLQPLAENLQAQLPRPPHVIQSTCPACGSLPQMAVLRPEGEGASRFLLCSFCLCEWLYRRLACPSCGEEDKEKLPRYSAQECAHVHVEACDNCKHYLKAVDLTIDGLAVPLVDEAALAVLDVWANDHGYTKIVRNLLGF